MAEANTKYALITGASSGIGKEIALLLAKKKMNLILVARRMNILETMKTELEMQYGIEVVVKNYDLGNIDNCVKLHNETSEFEPAIVINNAGFGQVGFFDKIPLDKEREMLRLNIESLHAMTKLYLSTMKEGVILNVASMAGFLPTPLMSAYAASKAYVLNFSRALNYELKKQKRNVRVLTLAPGPVDTEFAEVANATNSLKSLSAEKCARIAVKGIEKKKELIIPGFLMRLTHVVVKIVPTRWVLYFAYKLQKSKR
ncbi:MAG: SDR family oxidoreductase [Bacilli bacterium]|nr:SDR family oxidoreductase [Bacilli bacterium]MBN2696685.1 SDR family oxidoreductase [Bacilli bacterium]